MLKGLNVGRLMQPPYIIFQSLTFKHLQKGRILKSTQRFNFTTL